MGNCSDPSEPAYYFCQHDPENLDDEVLFENITNEQDCIHVDPHCDPVIQRDPQSKTETRFSSIQSHQNTLQEAYKQSQKEVSKVKLKSKKAKLIEKSTPRPMLQRKQNRENKGNNMDRDVLRAFRKSISEYFQRNPHLKILWVPIKKLLVSKQVNKSQIAALICIFQFLGCRLQIWSVFDQISFSEKFQEDTPARKEAEKTLASWNRGFSCDKLREITLQLRGSRKFDMDEALKQSEEIVDTFKNEYFWLRRS